MNAWACVLYLHLEMSGLLFCFGDVMSNLSLMVVESINLLNVDGQVDSRLLWYQR